MAGDFQYNSGSWLADVIESWATESYWMQFQNWKCLIILSNWLVFYEDLSRLIIMIVNNLPLNNVNVKWLLKFTLSIY